MAPSQDDLRDYREYVCEGMSAEDVLSPEELADRLRDGRLWAWWGLVEDRIAAWCAMAPRHGKYQPGAWHLYGVWVRPDMRGLGIAGKLWSFRLDLVPTDAPVTVSIQDGKAASFATAKRCGFTVLGRSGPWTNLVRHDVQVANVTDH